MGATKDYLLEEAEPAPSLVDYALVELESELEIKVHAALTLDAYMYKRLDSCGSRIANLCANILGLDDVFFEKEPDYISWGS